MKRITVFLTVLSVALICVFVATPPISADDDIPRRDPDIPDDRNQVDEWIAYDEGRPDTASYNMRNYFSRVIFTAEQDFELRAIRFMPFNPNANREAPCYIYVYSEDQEHNLVEQLWVTRVNELDRWDDRELDENWVDIEIPENLWMEFEE
ncbi:MAG: hypothetical protein P9M15_04445, partial [Candidatus Electryoneaceae bacterium]|nr:hypothetical protein [Candidatus Electryoneaceae bacterium]